MTAVGRVQAYLHTKAPSEYVRVILHPFTLHLDPFDPDSGNSYAIPHAPVPSIRSAVLEELCATFAGHQRTPYLLFLDEYAPALLTALPTAGFRESDRAQVMICTPQTLLLPSLPVRSQIVTLSSASPLDEIKEGLDVNARGFDPEAECATDAEAEAFRRTLHASRAFTLRLDGEGVSAGMFISIRDGVTELAGIATLTTFRRRGFAAVITAYMAQAAFQGGADLVFLSAASHEAGRVYARVGFRSCAMLLHYVRDVAG